MAHASDAPMPEELSSRHLRTRLLQLAALVAVVVAIILIAPGLGSLRHRFDRASAPWLVAAAALELLSTLSYVVVFRAVFCSRMSWRVSYLIGMAEQAANSLLPAGGAGGLALGVWALRKGGVPASHIARRTVAFFLLTSLANFVTLIVFAAAFAVRILGHDTAPGLTFAFGIAAAAGIVLTLSLPAAWTRHSKRRAPLAPGAGRVHAGARRALDTLDEGVSDSLSLLRRRPAGVLSGSFGYMAFDLATLGACFQAFGHSPALGVLVVAYLIGQLGGLLPIPGGIGGIEGGLIGVFALYHVPIAESAAAVLAYRAMQLWVPGALGSVAFVRLRKTLSREPDSAGFCEPLAEPIDLQRIPLRLAGDAHSETRRNISSST
jgi:uncharacterized membrane protein YbhN (UPF0104 family)